MNWFKETLTITTHGKGLHLFTQSVNGLINQWGILEGMCTLFIQHTSASIVISECYDPTAKQDIETFMDKHIPENQSWMKHTLEGGDDSSSHIRSILTPCSLTVPIDDAKLNLGMWQGIFIFEHRSGIHQRKILVRCLSVV